MSTSCPSCNPFSRPPFVVGQLDETLAALYGLLNTAVELIGDEVPEASEKHIICIGLITHFFNLYHQLNAAGLLSDLAFDRENSLDRCRRRSDAGSRGNNTTIA